MWGIVGAFLAVPLIACVNIVCARFKSTHWISVLLSKDGEIKV
jgi:predicted PurR-regulated permease PerM